MPVSIMQNSKSTGDIIDDVHAQEEHAKAIASTAEVPVLTSESLPPHQAFQPGCPIDLTALCMHERPSFIACAAC